MLYLEHEDISCVFSGFIKKLGIPGSRFINTEINTDDL